MAHHSASSRDGSNPVTLNRHANRPLARNLGPRTSCPARVGRHGEPRIRILRQTWRWRRMPPRWRPIFRPGQWPREESCLPLRGSNAPMVRLACSSRVIMLTWMLSGGPSDGEVGDVGADPRAPAGQRPESPAGQIPDVAAGGPADRNGRRLAFTTRAAAGPASTTEPSGIEQ